MPLNIKDPATEKSVRELALLTGETVTTAVRRAAEERLLRVRRERAGRSLATEILEIGRAARPCRISTPGRRTRYSATMRMGCHADGHRHLGHHCCAVE